MHSDRGWWGGEYLALDKNRESDLDIQCNSICIQMQVKLPRISLVIIPAQTFWLL